jgi:hypothetical protein
MSSSDPRSWPDKVVGLCLALLVGATAIYVAVRLIEAVWAALVLILSVGMFLVVAVVVLRARNQDW